MKARLADLGSVPVPMTPAEFGKFIADETEKWGKVIRAAHTGPRRPIRPRTNIPYFPFRECRLCEAANAIDLSIGVQKLHAG
jgi:hypothetical protein